MQGKAFEFLNVEGEVLMRNVRLRQREFTADRDAHEAGKFDTGVLVFFKAAVDVLEFALHGEAAGQRIRFRDFAIGEADFDIFQLIVYFLLDFKREGGGFLGGEAAIPCLRRLENKPLPGTPKIMRGDDGAFLFLLVAVIGHAEVHYVPQYAKITHYMIFVSAIRIACQLRPLAGEEVKGGAGGIGVAGVVVEAGIEAREHFEQCASFQFALDCLFLAREPHVNILRKSGFSCKS